MSTPLETQDLIEFLDQESVRRGQIACCHRLIDSLDQDISTISAQNRQLEDRVARMIESIRRAQERRMRNFKLFPC